MEIPNSRFRFAELSDYFNYEIERRKKEKSYKGSLVEKITEIPITEVSIEGLKKEGWRIMHDNGEGTCFIFHKLICLNLSFRGFNRDRDLCHEIAHAIYGEISIDSTEFKQFPKFSFMSNDDFKSNNAIIEYVGRKIRASSEILSKIWETFHILPNIYDKSSFQAAKIFEYKNKERLEIAARLKSIGLNYSFDKTCDFKESEYTQIKMDF